MKMEALPASDRYGCNRDFMKLVSDGLILRRENHNKKEIFEQAENFKKYQAG